MSLRLALHRFHRVDRFVQGVEEVILAEGVEQPGARGGLADLLPDLGEGEVDVSAPQGLDELLEVLGGRDVCDAIKRLAGEQPPRAVILDFGPTPKLSPKIA
jgi:hypothetical protein